MGRVINGERVEFGRSILLLATALGFDLDEAVIGVYWHAMKKIPAEARRQAFADASEVKWFKFPKPAEMVELGARIVASRRQAAAARHLADCEHTGHFIENSLGRMERCPCWTRAQQAMADVGQPIALPAHEEPHDPA